MRRVWSLVFAAIMVVALAAPAMASHTHVRMTGNGSCVILAANGHEHDVQLPHAGNFAENRQHPLHVNVHLGKPGIRKGEMVVWVQGSPGDLTNCQGYVND